MGIKVSETYVSESNYLKAADLNKRTVAVEIASADMENVGDDHKIVLRFKGKEKGLVLNKTNATTVAYAFGDDTDGWIGATIELYPTMTSFQGKSVECIRLTAKPPPASNAPTATPPEDRFYPNARNRTDENAGAYLDEEIPFAPEWR